ncbi:sodium:proton antiporter [Pseudomonas sp.]|uniref:sodium:proton antiporter n=1 Tax=Pseudomonas sp. TaxID=306 RepID=UPI002FC82515
MSIGLFWLGLLALFAAATWLGSRLRLIPIVSQLLLATLGLPLLMLWSAPHGFGADELLAADWLKPLYGVAFTLLLGHILSDVIDLDLQPASIKIALPSFFLPFFCGLACALWLLPAQSLLGSIAVGLLFALTAIPVLFLYLQHLGYPPARIRQLLQAAIFMDLLCWLIFGLAQGSSAPATLLWPLLAAGLPVLFKLLPCRAARCNGLCFLALLLVMQQLKLNALVFGIAYLLCCAALRVPLRLPLPANVFAALQTWLAVPLILAYGLLQIDWHNAWLAYSWLQFGALLLLPIASKLLGNWLGLSWAAGDLAPAPGKWRESVLLNTRGLTEIVFLNLLLHQQVISAQLYFALMLMGLISTLLPALTGAYSRPATANTEARSPYEVP